MFLTLKSYLPLHSMSLFSDTLWKFPNNFRVQRNKITVTFLAVENNCLLWSCFLSLFNNNEFIKTAFFRFVLFRTLPILSAKQFLLIYYVSNIIVLKKWVSKAILRVMISTSTCQMFSYTVSKITNADHNREKNSRDQKTGKKVVFACALTVVIHYN